MGKYEALAPLWAEWKRSTRVRIDPVEADRLTGMCNIFLRVAGKTCGPVNEEALEFVLSELPRWRAELGRGADSVPLFRGLVDEEAIEARTGTHTLRVGIPFSFTYSRAAALGFAGRGHTPGALIAAMVPIENVVFSDADGFIREGGAHKESEVVVVLDTSLSFEIVESHVAARKPLLGSLEGRRLWKEEADRLCSVEKAIMDGLSEKVDD